MADRSVPRETRDPLVDAIAFAIREALRRRRERTDQRATMAVVDGGRDAGKSA